MPSRVLHLGQTNKLVARCSCSQVPTEGSSSTKSLAPSSQKWREPIYWRICIQHRFLLSHGLPRCSLTYSGGRSCCLNIPKPFRSPHRRSVGCFVQKQTNKLTVPTPAALGRREVAGTAVGPRPWPASTPPPTCRPPRRRGGTRTSPWPTGLSRARRGC